MILRLSVETAFAPTPAATAMAVAVAFGMVAISPALMPSQALAQVRSNAQTEQNRTLAIRPSRTLPETGRYESASGEAFIFDRSGSRPLFRFERRTETWVLRPSPAPRGDIIYRNDAGDQILRVTPDGGMTLYTVKAPNGTPASMTGAAPSLTPPSISPAQLLNHAIQQSGRLSAAVGHLIYFDFDLEQTGNEAVVAETVSVVTDAVLRLARTTQTQPDARRIRVVNIVEGQRPAVTFSGGSLTVVSDPRLGALGRPSSARIIRAIRGD